MTFKREARTPPVIWAVVADRARARILQAEWPEADVWNEHTTLECEEGAAAARDVNTDGPGTFSESAGGHHGGQKQTDFEHQTAQRFADEIIAVLDKGRTDNVFGKLAVVAPPLFLGVLRKKLPAPLASMVTLELDKDYTQDKLEPLGERLQQALTGKS
jgi:protein required for attachment to host cells